MAIYSPAAVAAANRGEVKAADNAIGGGSQLTLIGWIVFLFSLFLINKTKTGHAFIFWGLALIAAYLLVANYRRIIPVLDKGAKLS